MKKTLLAVLLGLILSGGAALYAQESKSYKESEFYYYSVPIERIYLYRNGYIVMYRKGVNQMARTYIPMDWFTDPTGKADLIKLGTGKAWPYLTVYYKAGEFSHIRLYVSRSQSHETWAVVPLNVNMDEYFQDIESIDLEF